MKFLLWVKLGHLQISACTALFGCPTTKSGSVFFVFPTEQLLLLFILKLEEILSAAVRGARLHSGYFP